MNAVSHNKIMVAVVAILVIGIAAVVLYNSDLIQGNKEKPSQTVNLRGSGATFLQPQLEAWILEFSKENSNIIIEYQGIGSGAGQEQFFKELTDFCGSDPPLSHDKWLNHKDNVLQIPVILGAVAVVYNVPEIPGNVNLHLSGEVIALIYKGEIKYWDDQRIKALNPELADKLPHKEIIAVHRSDASGTTQIYTTFLHKAAPEIWPEDLVGKTIDWPVDKTGNGVGGKGNQGVTANVVNTKYSIGYVELAYAMKNNLSTVAIMNKDGEFVLPSRETIQAAATHALETGLIPQSPSGDFSKELEAIIYAPGKTSYPLTAFSHIFVWKKYDDSAKAEAIKEFLKWICNDGPNYIVEGYVAVPEEIKDIGLKAADMIEG